MTGRQRNTQIGQQTSYCSPSGGTAEQFFAFPVTVVFTTVAGTLDALRKAAQFAQQLEARIHILVPYVVPYPLPLDKPRVDPFFRLRQFRTVCDEGPIQTYIDIRLCRDAKECIQNALLPHSLLVIGGAQSWWPFSFEKRLARALTGAGHHVVLVGCR